jgi:tellurite resistance protein TehA-like permease
MSDRWITVAWVLWWIDSIVATIIAIGIPFMMYVPSAFYFYIVIVLIQLSYLRFTRHKNDSASITAIWLQPSVSTIVSAASGAIIASGLPDSHARLTITISYILLGIGFMPALLIMGIYFQRLTLYKVSAPLAFEELRGNLISRHIDSS